MHLFKSSIIKSQGWAPEAGNKRPTPEAAAVSKPRTGSGYDALLPGSLCSLALPGPQTCSQSARESTRPASDCSSFPRASAAAGIPGTPQPWPPHPFLSPGRLSKWTLISHCCGLLWSGWETGAGVRPTDRGRPQIGAGRQGLRGHKEGMHPCGCRCSWQSACDERDCGLWEQAQAGVRPGLSQSWPHRAHSRSRDLPRDTGGLSGSVDWLVLTVDWTMEDSGGLSSYHQSLSLSLFFVLF